MAMSPHFFNKRDETATPRHVVPLPQVPGYTASTSSPAPGGVVGATNSAANSAASNAANGGSLSSPGANLALTAADAHVSAPAGGSKLTVGPNIKLKGVEITDCDTLFVEGLVEATMDARLMEIAEPGAFKGSAEIDLAEIHGQFDGDLTVREKLVIYATGRVTGKIRYGKLVIEEGGQISGDIQFGAQRSSKPAPSETRIPLAAD